MPSAFLLHFLRHAGRSVLLSLLLLACVAILEAAGLMLLMPLMELLGLGQIKAAGSLQGVWRHAFLTAGLNPSLEVVLCGFVGLLILQAAARRFADHLNARIEAGYTLHLRDRLYRSMIYAQWQAFTRVRAADLTRILTVEVEQVGLAAQQAMILAGVMGMALVHVSVAAALSLPLTALALGCGLVLALGLRPLNRRVQAAAQASQRHRAEMNAAIAEHLAGFKIAKSHGRGEHHQTVFSRVTHAIAEQFVAAHRTFSTTRTCFELAGWVALVAFLYAAVAWAALPTAQLVLMVFVFTRLMPRLAAIQSTWQRLLHFQNSFATVAQLQGELDAAAEPASLPASQPLALQREIRLEQVTFRYEPDGGRAAVNELSLVIPARQMTALVGASGAGKSTIADLLLGLLTPTEGRVLVDGEPLDGPRLAAWRNSIGYVPQEPFLFHDTIRANLLWARGDATEDELQAALRTAAAAEFVARLPQGLDTVVGDRGVRLSGGERQRLTLARALLRRPTLLLLDEATSSLDHENERLIQQAIERLHGELTIVIIAHRLSTVQSADQIIVLEQGRVVESGAPEELARREGSAFRKLMSAS
jgi:ATP-binding cassette subfamily C protein